MTQFGVPALRVAVVGLGNWGSRLLAALLAMPEFEVVALCDRDAGLLARSPGPNARFTSLTELLANAGPQAVFVAVTPSEQARLGLQVLFAGRHLFIEKPMALVESEAHALVEAATAADRVVCVGHVVRYQPLQQEALELVRAGAIGKVRHVLCERIGARPRPGVSPWWVLAPHDLSFLFGAFPGSAHWLEVQETADRGTRARLALADGVVAHLHIAGEGTPNRVTILAGDTGTLVLDEASATLRRYTQTSARREVSDVSQVLAEFGQYSADVRVLSGESLQLELLAFQGAIEHGRPLPTDVHDGYRVVSALVAADALRGRGRAESVVLNK